MTEMAQASSGIWDGEYSSWREATEASRAKGEAAVFDGQRWADRILGQLLDFRSALAEDATAPPPRPCALPDICAASGARSVVDFGGSSGWAYDFLLASLGERAITSYTIVEIEPVVAAMEVKALHQSPVAYRTPEAALSRCDVLYCNSALQYAPSNSQFVDIAKRTNPRFILLDDLVAIGDRDFFTLQNYFDSTIPYRFIGLESFIDDMAGIGYSEQMKRPYPTVGAAAGRGYAMDNFPEGKRLHHSLTMLFSHRDSR